MNFSYPKQKNFHKYTTFLRSFFSDSDTENHSLMCTESGQERKSQGMNNGDLLGSRQNCADTRTIKIASEAYALHRRIDQYDKFTREILKTGDTQVFFFHFTAHFN